MSNNARRQQLLRTFVCTDRRSRSPSAAAPVRNGRRKMSERR